MYASCPTDHIAPFISGGPGGNQSVNTDAGQCTYTHSGTAWNYSFTDVDDASNPTTGNIFTYAVYDPGSIIPNNVSTLSGYVFKKGVSLVIYIVQDACNNSDSRSFNVTVSDNQSPTITCPSNQNVNTDNNLCTYTHSGILWDATGTDNCLTVFSYSLSGATSGSGSSLAGKLFNQGTTTVTWSVTDGTNAPQTCTFNVNVSDVQLPNAICKTNPNVYLDNTGNYTVVVSDINNGSNDALSIATGAGAATFTNTITGTTIYGSTAVCSPVGKFTSCIDAGSGTFSSSVDVKNTVAGDTTSISRVSNTNYGLTMLLTGDSYNTNTGLFDIPTTGNSNYPVIYSNSNKTLYFGTYSNQDIKIGTNNIVRLTIASTGAATFACSITATGGYFYGQTTNSFVRLDNTVGAQIGYLNYADIVYDSLGISFKTAINTTTTERMRITCTGNVLIGTSTISTAVSTNDLLTIGKSGSTSNAIIFSNGVTTNWGFIVAEECKIVLASSNNITFETGAGSTERMRLCSNGFAYFACELTAKTLGTNDLLLNNLNYECANYVDGTRGSWLIQEGACDLFIINQVSCKKYKFNLIEIK